MGYTTDLNGRFALKPPVVSSAVLDGDGYIWTGTDHGAAIGLAQQCKSQFPATWMTSGTFRTLPGS